MSQIPTDIRAYLIRHGSTGLEKPEGWSPARMTQQGRRQAQQGAKALKVLTEHGWPAPDYIASSPLPRAKQTADIAAEILDLPRPRTMPRLKAFDKHFESASRYKARTTEILGALIGAPLPLIAAHRSTTAILGQQFGLGAADLDEGLLEPGGVLAVTDGYLLPLHAPIKGAWPAEDRDYNPAYSCRDVEDDIESPDPDDTDPRPDEDRLRAIRAMTGGLETRSGRKDLTLSDYDGWDESVRGIAR
jgi:phosphohistidine phosphatase SixA